jgi:hypothetical protein
LAPTKASDVKVTLSVDRSILNPVSLFELSCHARLIRLEDTAVAVRLDGAIGVPHGVAVGVWVGVGVGVGVGLGVAVAVGVGIGVAVGAGVTVAVGVAVGVGVAVDANWYALMSHTSPRGSPS